VSDQHLAFKAIAKSGVTASELSESFKEIGRALHSPNGVALNGEKSFLRLTPLYSETSERVNAAYEKIVKKFSGEVKDTTNREWNASQGVG